MLTIDIYYNISFYKLTFNKFNKLITEQMIIILTVS